MRILLRCSKTGRYYGDAGQADAIPGKAMEFPNVQAATRHALSARVRDVEIALRCDYLSEEVLLPVVPEWGELDETYLQRISTVTPAAPSPLPVPS
jgi:hypothetical protein